MKLMKNLVLSIISIGLITLLAGCNIVDDNNQEGDTITISQNITHAASQNDTDSKIEMIDEVIPVNPKKVGIFDYGILDIFDSIGLDKLGIEKIAVVKSNLPTYLNDYNNDNVINAGTLFEPNIDILDLFSPDLVIISERSAWAYDTLKSELGGVAVLNVQIDNANYLNSVVHNLNNLKLIFDNSTLFDPLKTDLETKTNDLKTKVEATDFKALIVMTNGNNVTGFGIGSRFSFIHNELAIKSADVNFGNGDNNTHGDNISFEYIESLNPNIIFVVDRSNAIGGEPSIGILDNTLVNSTEAGVNNRIIVLDSVAWYIVSGGYQSTLTMISDVSVLYE